MPSDFVGWLTIISSVTTIISFGLYIRERHKRERQGDLMLGFMHGIKALIEGMAQAGDEWRYKVDEKPEGYSRGYINACANTWITLREQVNDMIAKLTKRAAKQSSAGDANKPRT
jgi:hypothetical protein